MNKYLLFRGWASYVLPSLLYFLVLFCVPNSFAQSVPVSGTVYDSQGALPGVNVSVKNTTTATFTDGNGAFQITATPEDTLVFSSVGYVTVTTQVGLQTTLKIIMQPDETALEEVLVNAGYYKVKDKERTGSIAKITAKDIENQPITNVLGTMQGRMAGVNITQTTGVPGGGFDIQIRGQNSIRKDGNQPLYIVDGLPFGSQNLSSTELSGAILQSTGLSPLNNINPADIESIEVLKDADATAIYGSRGANGVVLITTKKGKKGATKFSFNAYTGAGTITRKLKLLNTPQYIAMREEAFQNDGVTTLPDWAYDLNGTWDRNRYTNWQEKLIGGTAISTKIDAGVSGGSEHTQFMINATHFNETTVFPGDFGYRKVAVHSSINHQSENQRFKMALTTNYVRDHNNLISTDLTRIATTLAPNAPALYDQSGNLNWENGTWENPLRLLQGSYNALTKTLYSGGAMEYKLGGDFEIKTTFGYSDSNLKESNVAPHTIYNPSYGFTSSASSITINQGNTQTWSVEPQLNYQKQLSNSKFEVLVGTTFQETTKEQYAIYASDFTNNSLIENPAAAAVVQILNNNVSKYRYAAVFGRVNYNLKDRYFLNITGRRDGSSRFGPGKQFANFGAVGAAWIFSNEKGIEQSWSWLSFGKLRASYGTTGSDQIGDYQFLNTYTPSGNNYDGTIGLEPMGLYNPNFSWEINKKAEAAVELRFLKDRLMITTAYFRNRSTNQLVGIPLPGTTGFEFIQANLEATVENTGLEIEVSTVNFQSSKFKWSTACNLTLPQNKLIAFPELEGSVYANQYVVGRSLSIRKVYESLGVNTQTGIYEFRDFNGDGIISAPEDRQKIIDTSPKFYGGIQNKVSFEKWEFDFLLQFVKQMGINNNAVTEMPGTATNVTTDALNHWQQIGDVATNQIYTTGFNGEAVNAFYSYYASSDAAYSDASYLRLKNLSLSYTLPNIGRSKAICKLYLQAQNLLTFTKYKGADPENQGQGRLPTLRIISLGTQINF